MSSKNPLAPNTENMVKEGVNYMETKRNVVEKAITNNKEKNKTDAINKTDKPQSSQSKKDKSIKYESIKCMSLNK